MRDIRTFFGKVEYFMKIYDYDGKKNISGEKICELRKKNKISQTALAAKMQVAGVNLGRDSISRIESGARFVSDYELKHFADVLNVPFSVLIDDTE